MITFLYFIMLFYCIDFTLMHVTITLIQYPIIAHLLVILTRIYHFTIH